MIHRAVVIKNEYVADDKRELILQPSEPFSFKPGQYITILAPTPDGKKMGRSFSIASPLGEKNIILIIKIIPGGLASEYVDHLPAGEEIEYLGPLGRFVLPAEPQDSLFLATGTGIAPFIPMIHQLLTQTEKKVTLYLGFRHEGNVCYMDLLNGWVQQYPRFSFIPTLSQATTPDWSGSVGRVTVHLRAEPGLMRDKHIFICGNGSMVNEIEQIALNAGVPKEKIFYEKYNNL